MQSKRVAYLCVMAVVAFSTAQPAAHAVHLAGGLLALIFLWVRSRLTKEAEVTPRRQGAADAVTIYWHFMDALWIYLFLLLFLWR